jgi:ADP-ribose pyrophosphatase
MNRKEADEPYRTLETRYLLKTRWRSFREDRVDIGQGREITYSYAEVPRAAYVVPLTSDGQIVLIRQYRYPIRDWVLEVPAGSLETPEEDPAWRARQELREEVGGECQELIHLARFYSSSAHITLSCEGFLGTGVELGEMQLEETELLQRVVLPARTVLSMARRGEISEGQSAYAILLAEPYILAMESDLWVKPSQTV